ncbi:contractile injection system tape measure protein [Dokdonia ponticola]|uniref:Contractile injection system tape measure protein n=1 Tax=Dokdonia ponticola TaxID=2041041 RepID=A0ABV9I0V7_9FLAO
MILEQEHIINKVFLEVETHSSKVAHDLKDQLGMFLKEDILPYLENYFKSIEQQLPAEIVQIPQLTLDITVNSQDHFNALKTETKEKLVQKIAAILKAPSQATEEVVLINTQEHQARSLLFFIENGYTPWWKTASDANQFTQQEIRQITAEGSFSNHLANVLLKPICKKRCIQQFTNQELQILLTAAFKHTKEVAFIHDEFIKSLSPLSSVSRDFIWSEVISYLQSKNVTVLIEKLASVLVKGTSIGDVGEYAFAKAVLFIIQQGFNITKTEITAVLQKQATHSPQSEETLGSQLIVVFDAVGLSKEASTILPAILHDTTSTFKKEQQKKEGAQDQILDEIATTEEIASKSTEEEHNNLSNIKNKILKDQEITAQEKGDSIAKTTPTKEVVKSTDTQITRSQERRENTNQTTPAHKEIHEATQKEASQEEIAARYETFTNQFGEEKPLENTTIDTYIKEITSQQEEVFITNTGSYHVPNAGLIILHPYLKPFFYNCGIIDDTHTIIDPEVAVHTLHYLATKKEQQLESQLLFEKFLCGIPLKKPIQRHIQLSDTIKKQAEELLESVIENWGVLNNASPDLVRHEFLQRAGKLSFKEDNPKIVIERKTQDILVDKLPWGIGICRLPWLDHLVYTNW